MNATASVDQPDNLALIDDLPIPEFPRILYDKNPLEFVICQLRFPPVLKIEAELPSAFQEAIRDQFPLFSDTRPNVDLARGLPRELSKLLGSMLPTQLPRVYQFTSSDSTWQITLTRETLALTCRKYRRWEEFRRTLEGPFSALLKLYNPAFFSRIGLRFRDLISRADLGLVNVPWSDLLRGELAGALHSPFVENVKVANHQVVLSLSAGAAQVLVQHGLVQRGDGEVCYYIDNDFSTDIRRDSNAALGALDYFSKHSWRLFRWCIGDRLHNAMGPRSIQPRVE